MAVLSCMKKKINRTIIFFYRFMFLLQRNAHMNITQRKKGKKEKLSIVPITFSWLV